MLRKNSALAAILAAGWLLAAPVTLQAQKALVYCPVGIDATGCNVIRSALSADASLFPGGVDAGYDGSQSTVDLATADLSTYAVFVVPSLADGPDVQPYGLLRDATISARLKSAFVGRTAVWSGTPDVGSTNRSAKDGLIRNLAGWARPDSAGTHGPGLVAMQDNSDDATARYGWLGGVSGVSVAPDTTFDVYSNVQTLTATGQQVLTNGSGLQIGYANMATYGLIAGGTGLSSDATGGRTSRLVLITSIGEPSNPNVATITTDKEDYLPPDTVIVTGAGWEPGETVSLLLQEDPAVHPNSTTSTVADADGHILDQHIVIDSTHIGVRFTLTAAGQTSGKTAQATFTDATKTVQAATSTSPITASITAILYSASGSCPSSGGSPSSLGSFNLTSTATTIANGTNINGRSVKLTANATSTNPAGSAFLNWTSPTGGAFSTVSGEPLAVCVPGTNGNQSDTFVPIYATTSTSVASSANPSVFGQSVTFTATVTSLIGGTPTGTVTFKDGAATLGTGTLSGGQATFSTSSLSVASHSITAVYAGSGNFTTSTSPAITQTVNQSNTTTVLASSANPSTFGQAITLTATVTALAPGGGTPAGTVQFQIDGTNFGSPVTLNGSGVATSGSTSSLAVGPHPVAAIYSGNTNYSGSTSTVIATQTVNQASSTTTLTSSANPSVFGQSVTLTAAVKNGATPITVGNVTFIEGGTCSSPTTTLQISQPVNGSGVVTYTTAAFSVAAHSVIACYDGSGPFGVSQATLTQTVNKASTSTTITLDSPDPSTTGQAVTVNYAVAVTAPGSGTPTGNVTVTASGGSETCTGTVAAGTCSITLTVIGARTLTATYAGDGNVNTSTSAGTAHQVNAATTTTAVASSNNPSTFGQSVTLTATVTSGATPVTVGSVTFIEGGTCAAPTTTRQAASALNGSGQVTYTSSTLTGGSHTITACYGGGGSFAASSGNITQTVNAAATVLAADPATGTFGGSTSLSATLTSGGNPVSGKSIAFTLNGNAAGSATTNASGVASIASASLGSINAGTYPTGVSASFAGDASFAAASGTASLTVNPKATTLTLTTVPATVTYGGSASFTAKLSESAGHTISFSIDGTPVGTDVTNGGGNASVTVNFASFPAIGAGPHNVTATFTAETNLAGSTDTKGFTVTQAAATVALSNLSQTYDGTPKSATVTTTPAGLSTSVTYAGSPTPPTHAGSYAVVATITDPNYSGSASGTLVIAKANQTITFAPLANRTFGDPPFSVSATASSGLAVSFAVGGTDQCTIAGATVTLTGAGSCTVTASQAGDVNYNAAAPVAQSFTIAPAAATVVLNGLTQTYNGTPRVVTATTTPAGLTVNITYDGSATAPTNAGSYAVVGTVSDPNYTGSATGTLVVNQANQTITFAALGDKTFGDPDFGVSATASSGLAVSFAASGNCSVTGSSVHLTGAGSCTITASQAGNANYSAAPDVSHTFSIAKGEATLALSDLSHTYDGSPKSATVTTTPAGLTVVGVTYDGSPTAPTNAGSYAVVASLNNADYQATDATGTLVIAKATQTISFGALADKTFGDAPFSVSATGGASGNPVTFSTTTPATCSVAGSAVTLEAAGLCTIAADQAGNVNYEAAPQVTQSFTINKAAATLALSDLSHTYDGSPKSATVTTSPTGLTGVSVTYDGSTTAPTNAGSYAVVASLTNANYQASDASGTLVIAKANQTITFAALADKTFGDPDFSVSATASSGLAMSFAASGKCTVTGSTVHITGAGSCTVTASQAGNQNYEPATDVSQSFSIAKAAQSIVFAPLSDKTFGDAPFSLSATGGASGNPVVFASSTPATCSVSGTTATILHAGGCTITANQAGNDDYDMAAEVSQGFTIAKAAATLALSDLTHTYDGSPKSATVTTTPLGLSGVSVTYNGSPTAPTNAGSYAVVASLNNADYEAPDASGTLIIEKATATVVLNGLIQTYNGTPRVVTATTTPSGLTVDITYDGSTTAPTNAGSYAVVGTVNDPNYQGSASGTLVVNRADQTIAFAALADKTFGDPDFSVSATASSGLSVSFAAGGKCTVTGTTVHITGAGSCSITASQAGNANYNAAPDVIQSFSIAKATQSVAFAALADKTYGDDPFSLSATGGASGNPVIFASATPATCSVASSTATIEHAGGCTITANQAGNDDYEAAPEVSQSFTVNKAPATLALSDLTHTYSATPKSATVTTTPLGLAGVSVTYDGSPTAPTNAGSYAVLARLTNQDYQAPDASGTLVINQAPLTVTAENKTKVYGDPTPAFTVAYSGFAGTEGPSALGGTLAYSGSATTAVNVGSYTITPGGLTSSNYAIGFVDGTLEITKKALTVVADNKSKLYGASLPPFTGTVTGVVAGDNITANYLAGEGGAVTASTAVGLYDIIPVLFDPDSKQGNYMVTLTNGHLTISQAPLTVTADPKSRLYGAANPAFTATISGFVLGQNFSSANVTGSPAFSGTGPASNATTGVGNYVITPAAGSLSALNYTFLTANGASFVNGQLTIGQATSTTTAASVSVPYSEANQNVTLTATVVGNTPPVVGEGSVTFTLYKGVTTLGSATGPVTAGAATATYALPASTDVGPYSIVAEYTSAGNYIGSQNTGTLTVQPANLENSTATTDADFKSMDGADALFKKDGNLTTLRLQNTNPGTVHYQLTLKNITGVVIDAANGNTLKTIVEVPAMTNCGGVSCPSSVNPAVPAWILKGHTAVHVHPDDKTDDMPVQFSYKASGTCTDETSGYTSDINSIPSKAPKCIRVMGFAIPKRERARLDVHFEFRWKDTGLWSSSPDSKLNFRSGFAFKSTSTVNFPVAPSVRVSYESAGLIVAGQRVTAIGGFAFNSVGAPPPAGYLVRVFALPTDASCSIAPTDAKVVAQDQVMGDGFFFIWKKGPSQISSAVELPGKVKYYVQLCNGTTPVVGHSLKDKLVEKEFDQEDFYIP